MSAIHAWDVPKVQNALKTDADDELFQDLAEVLKRHSALDRFGITLLHKHFEIAADEALLETTDIESRKQFLTTVKRGELVTLNAIETSWRLGPDGKALWGCVCVQDPKTGQCRGHRVTQATDE